MRARRAILSLLLLSALPSTAGANYAFQGIVSASAGWTSNPTGAAAGAPGSGGDGLFLINPSIVFSSALARAVQRISYNFSSQFYATHPELTTIGNRLDWSGLFIPSRTTELQLAAYGMQSQLNSANLDSAGQITRTGTQTIYSAGMTEGLAWNWSPQGRLTQAATFLALIPTTASLGQTYTTSATLGLHRPFRRDLLGADLQVGYIYYQETRGPVTNTDGSINPDGVVTPTQQQISSNLLARWRHDFAYFWSVNLGAGVATIFRASDGGGRIWQPLGEAGAHYVHPQIQLDLTYVRAMTPSPIVQSTFVSDTVALRGMVPFGAKSKLSLSAGGSYQHNQNANTFTGSTGGNVDLFNVDGALNWVPLDWIVIFTRYTYQNQLADAGQSPPIASIERHLFMAGLTITYPPQGAAPVSTRQAIRVDGSDAVGIPDLHSAPNK